MREELCLPLMDMCLFYTLMLSQIKSALSRNMIPEVKNKLILLQLIVCWEVNRMRYRAEEKTLTVRRNICCMVLCLCVARVKSQSALLLHRNQNFLICFPRLAEEESNFLLSETTLFFLSWLGSTHLGDQRATSNPSSPSSSPHTPSALGSGSSDPVLNGGLCSAAYCSSAGGRYTQRGSYCCWRRESITPQGTEGKPL